ncbi:DNA repair protein complementing XP-G cells homolog [Lucilia sericata]|uniref:DNA repair protein complementing XP-G cells homolog n=1 Tax=Lucilia sericata TaxID=13632 RepID=UPI0018A82981|nr:DNA repair protein complementing XP-G cells homolog [Lucilia sericata]XP_037808321.1 DNA repair protein complementing XP-G cells homolog [Lucilia sericata]
MGVTGLWKLIEPCGKPVPVETLEGKVLAIDISIWLHQAIKGFQDNKGAALNNAHLLGLFHRLCKLMYYRVKPVFVFDGCVPQLKRDTIARRQQQRSKLNSEADRIQALLLQSLAKEKVVQQALGPNAELLLTSPIKKLAGNKASRKEDTVDDMFKLPELPSNSKSKPNEDETTDESFNESSYYDDDEYTTTSATDSSFDESNPRVAYTSNIQAIDVRSKEFLQLPADVRYEILVDIKETRKQSSWGRLHELPSRNDDFSNFQMKRLLKRRDVQVSLETAEQEMGGRTLTYAELTNIFSEEGILETDIVEKGTKQISSDEHTRFLLVKDLKKKLAQAKEEPIKEEKKEIKEEENKTKVAEDEIKPSTSKESDKKLGNEYDADLELAIALSLQDDADKVYDEKDYDYDSDESLKLTKAQRQQLQNAAKGPARSYMIEYAGMNKEEVAGILEKTQVNPDFDDTLDIERLIGDAGEKAKEKEPTEEDSCKDKTNNNESQDIRLCVTDSDATDSDLEEVEDSQKLISNTSKFKTDLNLAKDIGKTTVELNKAKDVEGTDSDLEEVKDSDATDSDLEEVVDTTTLKSKLNNKMLDLEDECVIEETPPCLADEELETKTSQVINIQIDLSKPLEQEDDLFADIFADSQGKEEIIEETPASIKEEDRKQEKSLNKEIKPLLLNEVIPKPPKSEKILSILDELKQQAEEVKNIKLENIKLSDSVIELSDDDEAALKCSKVKNEIIEVCDSDDNDKRPSTPPPQLMRNTNQSPRNSSKSPKFKTPSKNHSITEFFNVDYVVKRTPDKPLEGENEVVPKVKSPFFVRKTPRSGRKSGSNSPSPNKKSSKATKTLFGQDNESSAKDMATNLDNDFVPLKEPQIVSDKDVLTEAANILKSQKTHEELNTIASDLAKERRDLENERNRQDRMGMSITQRMNSDCQDLLRLFGVPFIVAPMEAEAQCAFLDIVQLTNGTITDDSDIWLFGGRTVYKNFFAQNKHVLEFRSEQIEKDFNCDRKKLIQLACLVGSDYTTGIHGIGTVTALEILASFTPKDLINNPEDSSTTSIQNILITLQRFRNWWQSFKSTAAPPGTSARLALQKKLKNIELHEGFPNTAVVEAYLTPKVDENKETFTWGYPDVESLREFAKKNFGWTTSKTDEILNPVLKKLNEKRTQQSIRNYFNVKNALSLRQIKVSKRVQNAIEKMSGNVDSDEAAEKPTKAKRARKAPTAAGGRKKIEVVSKPEEEEVNNVSLVIEPNRSEQIARGPIRRASKRVNIPETKQIIPQREKDLAQMEANKKLAAEILKKTAKETKRKRKT